MLSAVEVRRRRIWGVLSILLGVALIFVAILALTGRLGATSGSSGGTPSVVTSASGSGPSGSEPPATADPGAKAPLTVLNAGGTVGLAGRGRDAFVATGWEVAEVGNLSTGIPEQSTVYYPPDDDTAKAVAENLATEFPALAVAETPESLGIAGVVVVLTGDWEPGEG